MKLKEELGKNIKSFRKKHNITQEKLAEQIGIDPKNLSKIEQGKNYPSAETITAIAKTLGINLYELFVFNEIPYEKMKQEIISALDNEKNIVALYNCLNSIM